jgi:tetratricopeptide (TPR) repeat protein
MLLACLLVAAPAAAQELPTLQELVAEGRYEEALSRLEPFIRENPEDAEARFLRGVILAQMGEAERAIGVFQALTEQFPELSEPYNNLAVLYASQGDYERARGALLRAIELQPEYPTAHENLGDVYAKLSALAYQRAYELQEGNQRARAKHEAVSRLLAGIWDEQPPRADAPPPAATSAGAGERPCLESRPVANEALLGGAAAWLEERGARTRIASGPEGPTLYQVYLPADDPQQLIAELADHGITDVAPMGSADGAPGLSLGVFRKQASVARRKGQLEALGFTPRVRAKGGQAGGRVLHAEPPDDGLDLSAYRERFPRVPLRPAACD